MAKKRGPSLNIGNIYCLTYDDHFFAYRAASGEPELQTPAVLRAIGRLIIETPTHYCLRSCDHNGEQQDVYGIMKSCVTQINDLGPYPKIKES